MSMLIDRAEKVVPEDVQQELIEVVEEIREYLKLFPTIPAEHMQYLFEVHNRYISAPGQEEDINCAGCRTAVWKRMQHLAEHWSSKS